MTRYVYDFDEPSAGGRELLGGKGIGLAEMTQLGVPVPAGFTITTDACRAYMREGGLPEGLEEDVARHIAVLEQKTGKRFGDAGDPLLVSVRSGAAVSMPGMMDTILNLGLNDAAVEGRTRMYRFCRDHGIAQHLRRVRLQRHVRDHHQLPLGLRRRRHRGHQHPDHHPRLRRRRHLHRDPHRNRLGRHIHRRRLHWPNPQP